MQEKHKTGFSSVVDSMSFYHPQEVLQPIKKQKKSLLIGLPKETSLSENRIALRPDAVQVLVRCGHEILIETGAGNAAKYKDEEYANAGARIVYSSDEAFKTDIVLKVAPPSLEEISMMKDRATLISTLQLANIEAQYLVALNHRRITAVAFELIEDKAGNQIIVRAMSEIAGSTVMLIAAEYLSNAHNGKGIILGGITGVPPTNVMILGAGTVAEYAARTALGLGACVRIFDDNLYKLRRLKENLGNYHLYTSTLDRITLQEKLRTTDVVIGALRAENGRTPCVISEDMIKEMRPNSVIIDVSIDNGGCFETSKTTTHQKPVFKRYDVIHYCVPNIASRVAHTASQAISNIFLPILLKIADSGGVDEVTYTDTGFAKGVYSYLGELSNEPIARKYAMRFRPLSSLIMASRM
jgi:alanine dehydrogenase